MDPGDLLDEPMAILGPQGEGAEGVRYIEGQRSGHFQGTFASAESTDVSSRRAAALQGDLK